MLNWTSFVESNSPIREDVYNPSASGPLCHLAFIVWLAKWRHNCVSPRPRDKCDCDSELSAVPISSTTRSAHYPFARRFSVGDPGKEEAEESEGPERQGP